MSNTPSTIGRFSVVRLLGQGAQGQVFLAEDPQLERQVAIKILHIDGADGEQSMRQLLEEARTIASLQHPNIVAVYDTGTENQQPYLVFEYVEGTTLDQLLKLQGPLSIPRAAELISGVLDGMAYAHLKGVVHRDIKPSNILIDPHGTPRIMDFGIATRGAGNDRSLIGTPLYLAPEYILDRVSTPRCDLFAAGMVLYQTLTGRHPIEADSVQDALEKIVRQPFPAPSQFNGSIQEKLNAVVLKALAKNPEDRFADALDFKRALHASLSQEEAAAASPSGESKQSVLDFLLRRMRFKSDFPALSQAMSTINKVVGSEEQGAAALSNAILKDFALTNKLLRLVNTAYYGQFGGTISTISRAVVILGFETIRNVAITLILFEHLQNQSQAGQLKDEIIAAFFSGLLARDLVSKAGIKDAEEALICAMFHRLGKLLTLYYFHDEALQINLLIEQKTLTEEDASFQVLGVSYADLGIGVAEAWNFPQKITFSMQPLTDERIRKPQNEQERLRVLSGLADEMTRIVGTAAPGDRHHLLVELAARFGGAVSLNEEQYQRVIEDSLGELQRESVILNVDTRQTPFFRKVTEWNKRGAGALPSGTATGSEADITRVSPMSSLDTVLSADQEGLLNDDAGPGKAPHDPEAVLAAGIQDITNTLVDDYTLNDVLRMILEVMYRGMGFTRVLLGVRDARSNGIHGRFGFGPDIDRILKTFRVPLQDAASVFHAALSQNVDIYIADIDAENIRTRVPEWYRKLIPAKSFIVFPIVIGKKPIGLFYADKDNLGELNIQAKELRLLKTLRNQAVLAIKQKY